MKNPHVSVAGDYAVLESGELYFYYGYEYIWCNEHKAFAKYPGLLGVRRYRVGFFRHATGQKSTDSTLRNSCSTGSENTSRRLT